MMILSSCKESHNWQLGGHSTLNTYLYTGDKAQDHYYYYYSHCNVRRARKIDRVCLFWWSVEDGRGISLEEMTHKIFT